LTQSIRLRVLSVLFFLALPLHAPHAGVRMEVGGQAMQLDRGLSAPETGEPDSAGSVGGNPNDVILQTPPRPAPDTTTPDALPFGIVPEVLIPWHPPSPEPPTGGKPKPPIGKVPPIGAPPIGVPPQGGPK